MEARTKNTVEEETCFFRDGKRGIGNSLLIVELARLPPFVTVKLSPFISLQIEKKIISNSDNIDNQPKQRESLLYQNLNSIKRIPTMWYLSWRINHTFILLCHMSLFTNFNGRRQNGQLKWLLFVVQRKEFCDTESVMVSVLVSDPENAWS